MNLEKKQKRILSAVFAGLSRLQLANNADRPQGLVRRRESRRCALGQAIRMRAHENQKCHSYRTSSTRRRRRANNWSKWFFPAKSRLGSRARIDSTSQEILKHPTRFFAQWKKVCNLGAWGNTRNVELELLWHRCCSAKPGWCRGSWYLLLQQNCRVYLRFT